MIWETRGYMVRKELNMDKLNLKGARRTWNFKERLRSGKETRWPKICLEEIERKAVSDEGKSKWEKEKKKFIKKQGISLKEIREKRREQIWGK